ncbi:peptide/nickel transport system permease protein [Streptomyces sp. 2333.5]|uniref:ABC transporter permease n=1 Tax=unclassified Streptomyces TaxID=2593676 RepID=UPI0008997CEC|nr:MULTISPECIES: ABC transporter permease [unclassified Streptomyces]PJJ05978.1 peptide/nickel transport system permease protein [Streptomyces sp. 2333.5]SEE88033.1 peptide/nickel transport system permease protein [Streptomyces sp. 2314.4]SEF05673.1 peptide/nickel transport system permease protein [Streptomyces sp. 2112.2]
MGRLPGWGQAAWWLRRIAAAVGTLLVASLLVFAATTLAPGDAAAARLTGRGASAQQIAALHHSLGLDRPAWERYASWLWGVLHGDLGRSYAGGEEVSRLIAERGGNSLLLGVLAAALLVPLAIGLGLWSGLRAGRTADRLVTTSTLTLVSLPEFVIGTLLIQLFAVGTGWLPAVSVPPSGASPLSQPQILVLPVLTLLSVCLAQNVRLIRAGTVAAADSDAVRTARLGGIPERRVVLRWVLPSAVVPAVPVLARYLAYLLGGTLVAETLFGYPGLAAALVNATAARDAPVVLGVSMLIATVTVLMNLVADALAAALNPAARRTS